MEWSLCLFVLFYFRLFAQQSYAEAYPCHQTFLLKDTLEYRKAKRLLRVQTQDQTLNTLLVDNSKTIAEVMDDICRKLRIPNNKESSLAFQTDKSEDENLDKDDERIKRQMRMLQEKQNLHTEAEGGKFLFFYFEVPGLYSVVLRPTRMCAAKIGNLT